MISGKSSIPTRENTYPRFPKTGKLPDEKNGTTLRIIIKRLKMIFGIQSHLMAMRISVYQLWVHERSVPVIWKFKWPTMMSLRLMDCKIKTSQISFKPTIYSMKNSEQMDDELFSWSLNLL